MRWEGGRKEEERGRKEKKGFKNLVVPSLFFRTFSKQSASAL